jgi:hypothetical protein
MINSSRFVFAVASGRGFHHLASPDPARYFRTPHGA